MQQGGINFCMKCNGFLGMQQQFRLGAEGTRGLQHPSALGISALHLTCQRLHLFFAGLVVLIMHQGFLLSAFGYL